jgi:FkbM family methyltransferase
MNILQEIQNLKGLFNAHPLWGSRPAAAWRRFAHFQFASLFSKSPRTFKWIDTLELIVPKRSGLTGNLYCGLMDFEEMMFLLHFLREEDLFLDVGANAGVYSLLASGMAGARSMAFEPVPVTYDRLNEHVRLNRMEHKVQCINQGIGEQEGALRFSTGNRDCLNHVLENDSDDTQFIEVSVTTLDKAAAAKLPAMLKLDIEGYEWYALKGASELLQSDSLKAIVLEYNLHAKRYGISPEQISALLKDYGYETYRYDAFARRLEPSAFNTSGNSLWVKDVDVVSSILKQSKAFSIYGQTV